MLRLVRKYSIFLLFSLVFYTFAGAQNIGVNSLDNSVVCACEQAPVQMPDLTIGFENDKATINPSYGDNAAVLQMVSDYMRTMLSGDNSSRVVIIEGSASPVGKESYNISLALRRAEAVRDFLRTIEGAEQIDIRLFSLGEDWATFTREVVANFNHPNRDKVLEIIRSSLPNDEKEVQLRNLDAGKTYRELISNHMASARSSAVIHFVELADLLSQPSLCDIKPQFPALQMQAPTLQSLQASQTSQAESAEPKSTKETKVADKPASLPIPKPVESYSPRVPIFAVRSNLLVPALNVGVEVPIGNNWSVGADYYFPWLWPNKDNINCFEFLGWGIEGRYWFGKNRTAFDRLKGHSVGLYGYMGYYDFERNYHGHQGEFVNVGLDYTYAMAVGKKKSVHFEFSLGVGFIYSQARKYTVIEAGAPLISDKITKHISFFGPTKANISLVVPIFQKVKPNNKVKGSE